MTDFADLELSLHRRDDSNYSAELRFTQPNSDADIRPGASQPISVNFDLPTLQALIADPVEYGKTLATSLFADDNLLAGFSQVRVSAQTLLAPLRVRLLIGPSAPELNAIYWETLQDPQGKSPLFTSENILPSRYLHSDDWRPVILRPRGDLKALAVASNPSNLKKYKLAKVDVPGELQRAKESLRDISVVEMGGAEKCTLNNIFERLRNGIDVFYLAAHGTMANGEPRVWLQADDGKAAITSADELVTRIKELQQPPRLIVLASCQSAGKGAGDALQALGPRLAQAGVPAVIAMQGNISMDSVKKFMPVFFSELSKDGQIDRALAMARGTIRKAQDFWMPVLFMRLRSGKMWYAPRGDDKDAENSIPFGQRIKFLQESAFHIYSSPPKFHPDVIGRESEIEQILRFVSDKDNKLEAFLAINGAPGMGKTVLAANICRRAVQNNYQIVWIDSEAFTSLYEILQALATSLMLPSITVQELRNILHKNQIILVFDQIDHLIRTDLPDLLTTLEAGMLGKVILTCRLSSGLPNEKPILLEPLTSESSQQLFLRAWGKSWEDLDDSQKDAVQIICQEYLQGVPMRLSLIGAAMARDGNDSGLRFWVNRLAGADNNSLYSVELDSAYKSQVESNYRTIATAFEDLDDDSKELLSRLVLIGSKVSFQDMKEIARVRPAIDDYKSAESLLRKRELVYRDDQKSIYGMHSNVQEYVLKRRIENAPNIRELKHVAAKRLIFSEGSTNWSKGLQYLFDIGEWFDLIKEAKDHFGIYENTYIFSSDNHQLLKIRAHYAMAYMFYRQGEYKRVLQYAKTGIDLLQGKRTLAAKSLLIRFNNTVAYALKKLNNDLESVKRYIDANEEILQGMNKHSQDLLRPDLGQHYSMMFVYESESENGDLDKAEKYALDALDIFEKTGNQNYQLMALSNLASIYYDLARIEESIDDDQGRTEKSIYYDQKSIFYSQKILDPNLRIKDYYVRASEYANLVDTLIEIGEDEQAISYVEDGIRYCREYSQLIPLTRLLLNAVYLATKPETAKEWTTEAEKYVAAPKRTRLDEVQITAARVIVNYLEAIDAKIPSVKKEKLNTARELAKGVYKIQTESQEDKPINEEAKRLLKKQEKFESMLSDL